MISERPDWVAAIHDDVDRARRLGAAAMVEMAERGVAPTPDNYAIWYVHAAGSLAALSSAIEILASNRQVFTPSVCADLYERFFGHQKLAVGLGEVGAKIEEAASQALAAVEMATADAREYGENLDTRVEALARAPELARMREVVQSILTDTRSMIGRTVTLEQQLSRSGDQIRELRQQVEHVRRESLTDPLTGIGNRKLFDLRLRESVRDSMEAGSDLCLMMLDIDHFKKFNDTWGHPLGDVVLRLVAKSLIEGIKGRDIAARYGGEEFAIILPETTLRNAEGLAESLRRSISRCKVTKRDTKESLGQMTISFGVAAYRPGEPIENLIERADAALYRAKQTGRNRVVSELALDPVSSDAP